MSDASSITGGRGLPTDTLATTEARSVAAAVTGPAAAAVVGALHGYPVPATPAAVGATALAGVVLSLIGLLGWWSYSHGDRLTPLLAVTAVGGGVTWCLLGPWPAVARVGGATVVAGDPRFPAAVASSPLFLVVLSVVAAVGATRDRDGRLFVGRESQRLFGRDSRLVPGEQRRPVIGGDTLPARRTTVAVVTLAATGVALATLAATVLAGSTPTGTALLAYALGGEIAAVVLVGYLLVRVRLHTPAVVFALVAAYAGISVALGGSSTGFLTAWPVWLLSALPLAVVEAVGRWLIGRLHGTGG